MEDRDFNIGMLIIILAAFAFGFLVASAIYDDRPISQEDYNELQKTEWYE